MKRILLINPPVLCINECQREWYSFAHPTSLLKIAAYHKALGNSVDFIDCMEYENEWHKPLQFYKKMPLGTQHLDLKIDAHVLGKPFDRLRNELLRHKTPDEIWLSCHIMFNAELAHHTIAAIKQVLPGIPVIFGGNYPTLFPEEAGKSGLRFSQADSLTHRPAFRTTRFSNVPRTTSYSSSPWAVRINAPTASITCWGPL
jgi:hypothetical protein